MNLSHAAVRIEMGRAADTPGLALKSQLLHWLTQVALASVFVPVVFLILGAVGTYMVAEWIVLQIDAALRTDDRRLSRPIWARFSPPLDDPIEG